MTLTEIKALAKDSPSEAMMMATQKQFNSLAKSGFWSSEDDFARYEDAQEDMRCLLAEAHAEFG